MLPQEPDRHVRVGGELRVDVAREFGYRDGSAVTQLIKRLDTEAAHGYNHAEDDLIDRS